MAQQQAFMLFRDIKKNFTRGVSAGTTAQELVEDFSEVYNSPVVMGEWEQLARDPLPNQPMDEVEEYFLTLNKVERAKEYEKLKQKLKFLETIDINEDIKGNQFVGDVLIAMDEKVKVREAEKAAIKTRQQLGRFKPKATETTEPAETVKPSGGNTLWNFFGSDKRQRDV